MTSRLELRASAGAVRLRLRVRPGARRSEILGEHGGALRISVAVAPERGRANAAVIALLAERLSVARSAIEILAGESSPDKVVRIAGVDPAAVERLLLSR